MNKKIIIIASGLFFIFAVLGVVIYFYMNNAKKTPEKNFFPSAVSTPNTQVVDITQEATQGVLPSINTNPLENKPDINPADKANPFKNIETNPFR